MTDPYRLLGVPESADDEGIRAAYLAALRACPPERDPQRFEQVRAAYEAISSEPRRLAHALFNSQAPTVHDVLAALSADWPRPASTQAGVYRVLGRPQ